jgi:uncharacterized protein (DUF2336 family)
VDGKDRVDLSRRLADIGNAPVRAVTDLAQDADLAVAEPVLERSIRLNDNDLLTVAGEREQGHLLAVSRRRALSERVADVLVKRGDQTVLRTIAQNEGAKLSDETLTNLVQKALGDNDLRSALLKRPNMPSERLRVLTDVAPQAKDTKPKPNPKAAADMQRMEGALAKLAVAMTSSAEPSRDIAFALERLTRTTKGKPVEEVRVSNWIKAEKIDDALAALALNSGLPADTVVRAYDASDYEPLLLVVRAARVNWNIFKILLTARDGKVPSADLVKTSFENFQHLPIVDLQQLKGLVAAGDSATAVKAA